MGRIFGFAGLVELNPFRVGLFALLFLAVPVPMTDFLVGAGFVPVGIVLVQAVLYLAQGGWAYPLPLALYWMAIPWTYLLLVVARLADRGTGAGQPRVFVLGAVAAALLLLSALPIYVPLAHGREEPVDLYRLYGHEFS